MSITVLVAGNHFIRPGLFTPAVHEAAGDRRRGGRPLSARRAVGALCQPWCISGQARSRKPVFERVFAQVVGW
ncbi:MULTISPECIES: hypothetical protein [unclassified Streptomyces]|uniref:hypothetical protein n=1 Tax=unclassified Streptomyces TaxID=2593676 RepID=UPI0008927A10|nr:MULTISPECIES: hypothetical protein [unclassified Streptomyces]PBC86361.1 hypothetical protein BX261_6440 [Streptomyces sp. 2321.6]SDQ87201.1 hypothetical protein SAMN05216511_0812 [Streptomyces sp. KS_16]SED96040.1 hypothetical protein SAMN05428940_6466 [Streptomyces sp. 2133.1]SNC73243.1 hypothetical protein SAMN06272741_6367 [Streptomyces sp. 2114.4]